MMDSNNGFYILNNIISKKKYIAQETENSTFLAFLGVTVDSASLSQRRVEWLGDHVTVKLKPCVL